MWDILWVLPHLSNSWIMHVIWVYIALNRTPNIDCYWVGAVPKIYLGSRVVAEEPPTCPSISHRGDSRNGWPLMLDPL